MSGTSVPTSEPTPNCPKCERPMARRTARRGSNAGSDFCGCPEFPRCRGIVAYEPTAEAPVGEDSVVLTTADEDQDGRCGLCTAEMKIKGAQIEHVEFGEDESVVV